MRKRLFRSEARMTTQLHFFSGELSGSGDVLWPGEDHEMSQRKEKMLGDNRTAGRQLFVRDG